MSETEINRTKNKTALKQLREDVLQLTQRQFADLIGVDPGTVSKWERGVQVPTFTIPQIKALTTTLNGAGISIFDLPDDLAAQSSGN